MENIDKIEAFKNKNRDQQKRLQELNRDLIAVEKVIKENEEERERLK